MTASPVKDDVHLWVRSEPFVNGVLPMPPNHRLSAHYIKKLVAYSRMKGEHGYPDMWYSIWRHVACNKLQHSEDLAWMYYCVYELVNDDLTRVDWWKLYNNADQPANLAAVRGKRTVNLYRFSLLLYLQQMNVISLRSSLISGGDEWPGARARSPAHDTGTAASIQAAKHMDEHAHLQFIMTNLNELLDLLVEPDSYSLGESSLTMEAVEALSFLFEGSTDNKQTILPIHRLVKQPQIQLKAGYSKLTQTYSVARLSGWIKSYLGENMFGVQSCISRGRRLSWLTSGDKSGVKRGKLATNAHLITEQTAPGQKLIILSQVCKETLAKSCSVLEGATVKIHRCHQAFIYLLSPLRTVSVEKCRDSTIVLGPVESAVHLSHCERLTVITLCHTLSISYSRSCTIHVTTPTRPLLFNGNAHIKLAPYNTAYSLLSAQLNQANLSTELNLWDKPLYLGNDSGNNVWELMAPDEFYLFTIPFNMTSTSSVNQSTSEWSGLPAGLPSRYVRVLRQREKNIEHWHKTLRAASLNREQRKQFQQLVEKRFQAWLSESGCKLELDLLANLATREKKLVSKAGGDSATCTRSS